MAEEHVTEEGCIDAAAPSASGEFTGYGLNRVDWAVHRDGVRRSAVVGEGDAVWVGVVLGVGGITGVDVWLGVIVGVTVLVGVIVGVTVLVGVGVGNKGGL